MLLIELNLHRTQTQRCVIKHLKHHLFLVSDQEPTLLVYKLIMFSQNACLCKSIGQTNGKQAKERKPKGGRGENGRKRTVRTILMLL